MKRWLLLMTAATACSSRKDAPPKAAEATVTVDAGIATIAATKPPDPELARLADAAVRTCVVGETGDFSERCPDIEKWLAYRGPAGVDEAALVEMLEHGDAKHRHLAALQLLRHGKAYRTDRSLAARMLAVAKNETSEGAVFELSDALGSLDLKATASADELRDLVAHHPSHIMRGHIVAGLLVANPTSDDALAITRAASTDPNYVVRVFALDGMMDSGVEPAETCARALDAIAGEEEGVSDSAFIGVRDGKACRGRATQIIDAITQRMDAGKLRWNPNAGVLLQQACQDPATSVDDHARAAALGRRFVAKNDDLTHFRSAGLYAVFACDPAGGRELARSLKRDEDLAEAAKAILSATTAD